MKVMRTSICYATALLFAVLLLGIPSRAAQIMPPPEGDRAVPNRGLVRVPIIIVDAALDPATEESLSSFFNNELDSHTFRNYWYVNSLGKYDVRSMLTHRSAPAPVNRESQGEYTPDWYSYFASLVQEMVDEGEMNPGLFDTGGPYMTPDGWMDGAVVFSKEFTGAFPVFPTGLYSEETEMVKPGPFVAAGPDASAAEVLRAFATLLGFKGDTCLSIISPSDNGFPLVDAYNRIRAGWADVMEVKGPQQVLIMPALTTGKVYKIGEEREYFLVENRGAGEGYDLSIKEPGLAIYHVIDSAPRIVGEHGDSKWYRRVVNESPNGTFTMQVSGDCDPSGYLYRDGDRLVPDYESQNPPEANGKPANSNWHDGKPSDIAILNIDTETHYPIITAVFGRW